MEEGRKGLGNCTLGERFVDLKEEKKTGMEKGKQRDDCGGGKGGESSEVWNVKEKRGKGLLGEGGGLSSKP